MVLRRLVPGWIEFESSSAGRFLDGVDSMRAAVLVKGVEGGTVVIVQWERMAEVGRTVVEQRE